MNLIQWSLPFSLEGIFIAFNKASESLGTEKVESTNSVSLKMFLDKWDLFPYDKLIILKDFSCVLQLPEAWEK